MPPQIVGELSEGFLVPAGIIQKSREAYFDSHSSFYFLARNPRKQTAADKNGLLVVSGHIGISRMVQFPLVFGLKARQLYGA